MNVDFKSVIFFKSVNVGRKSLYMLHRMTIYSNICTQISKGFLLDVTRHWLGSFYIISHSPQTNFSFLKSANKISQIDLPVSSNSYFYQSKWKMIAIICEKIFSIFEISAEKFQFSNRIPSNCNGTNFKHGCRRHQRKNLHAVGQSKGFTSLLFRVLSRLQIVLSPSSKLKSTTWPFN